MVRTWRTDPGKGPWGEGRGASTAACCGRARARACLQATEFYSAYRLVLGNREEHAQRVHPAVKRVGVSMLVDRPLTATSRRQATVSAGGRARKKRSHAIGGLGRTIWWYPRAQFQRTSPEDAPAGSGPRIAPARSSRRPLLCASAAAVARLRSAGMQLQRTTCLLSRVWCTLRSRPLDYTYCTRPLEVPPQLQTPSQCGLACPRGKRTSTPRGQ